MSPDSKSKVPPNQVSLGTLLKYSRLMLRCVDEDADTEGKDEGLLGIAELDGFFTAIVSGPVMILPSQWLPAIWGEYAPLWKDEKEFESVFSMLMRHMNVLIRDSLLNSECSYR